MSLLNATNLAQSYGDYTVFSNITVEIPHQARIALVGPNGAGKTTLLSVLLGESTPSSGEVQTMRNLRMGFLPQRPELHGGHSLYQEVLGAFAELRKREHELTNLEHQLAQADAALLERYGRLQEQFEADGGYTYTQRIKTVLEGLGFNESQFELDIAVLSGGQKTRALLARLLLESPDLLMLDEPTNHLDVDAIEWLEGYLKEFSGAVLAISHDRYFIDNFANVVWELDFGRLDSYRANYTRYLTQREERRALAQKQFEAQQAFISKEEEYIRRNIAGQNTRQAQGRRTRLDRLKRDNLLQAADQDHDKMHFQMSINHRGNEFVIQTKGATVGYHGKPLLQVGALKLGRGEIAALIGANGVGKSTLIKTILGQIPPIQGEMIVGDKIEVGYFAQAHEGLNPEHSIMDELLNTANAMTPAEARHYLARYLFRGDDVFRKVGALSGGERGRVALAKLALGTANLLLLDEPTNHLDIPSQEVLEEMLTHYRGTVILISHDRYLVDAIATQIWIAHPPQKGANVGQVSIFEGGYADYMKQREADLLRKNTPSPASVSPKSTNGKPNEKKHGLNPFELKKRLEAVEKQIAACEVRLTDLSAQIETASTAADAQKIESLGKDYTRAEHELEQLMEEWERLMS